MLNWTPPNSYISPRLQYQAWLWANGSYTTTTTPELTWLVDIYTWGLDLSGSLQGAGGVGGLLAVQDMLTQGVTHFTVYDGNGNVAALMHAQTGVETARYEYGPFGELLRATGPMARVNPFRFSTKFQDEETSWLYYGYRYYDANTGRWLSRDPSEEAGGINLNGFVFNCPNAFVDPLGLKWYSPFDRDFFLKSAGRGVVNVADYSVYQARRVAFSPLKVVIGDKKGHLNANYNGIPGIGVVNHEGRGREGTVLVIAVNGLNNFLAEDYYDDLEALSRGADLEEQTITSPYPIHYVYNYSYINETKSQGAGVGLDLVQAGLELGGLGMVDATSSQIATIVNKALSCGQYKNVILVGHSHGGIKISTAMSGIKPHLRSKVSALTYGSAHLKPFLGARGSVNVHRRFDFVSGGAGMHYVKTIGFQMPLNMLGITDDHSQTQGLNGGSDKNILGVWPYTHSFDQMHNPKTKERNGYSILVPRLLHQMIKELEEKP